MELIVRGHHLELTPSLQTYVGEKIGTLEHYSHDVIPIGVELSYDASGREDNAYCADARVEIPGPDLRAEARASEMHEAIDLLRERLKVQLRKHKERAKDHRRG